MSGSDTTLYERLGGREAIAAVVDEFYDRVLDDERLRPYFEETDMSELEAHMTEFLCSATGGPVEYEGKDMRSAHAHLDVDEGDFGRVAQHLEETLVAMDVPERERSEVLDRIAGLKGPVVGD